MSFSLALVKITNVCLTSLRMRNLRPCRVLSCLFCRRWTLSLKVSLEEKAHFLLVAVVLGAGWHSENVINFAVKYTWKMWKKLWNHDTKPPKVETFGRDLHWALCGKNLKKTDGKINWGKLKYLWSLMPIITSWQKN